MKLIPNTKDFKTAFSIASKSLLSKLFLLLTIITGVFAVIVLFNGILYAIILPIFCLFIMLFFNIMITFMAITFPTRFENEVKPLRNSIVKSRSIIAEGSAQLKTFSKKNNIKYLFTNAWLFLTDGALEYYPANIIIRSGKPTAVLLDDIVSIHSNGENSLTVVTTNDKYDFFVWRAYTWEEKIKETVGNI